MLVRFGPPKKAQDLTTFLDSNLHHSPDMPVAGFQKGMPLLARTSLYLFCSLPECEPADL
jgi:hypothetical protein